MPSVEQAAPANELQMSQMQFQQELIKFMCDQQQRPRDDPKWHLGDHHLLVLVIKVMLDSYLSTSQLQYYKSS
jgi:hypothetical protein